MGFQLIHEDEPLPPKNLVAIIFGEPGVGKSSLAFTAASPLMMDFDKGLERAVGRKLSVKLSTWEDALQFIESDTITINKILTLIVDTAGTMLDDYLSHHIIKMDEKFGNGAGGLGLRGFGVMKDSADKFISKAQKLGVDLIFVCHTAQEKDGDTIRLQPKMTGGAYQILLAKSDLVGYMEMRNGKITIDFNPTTRHTGKNCAQLPLMDVPNFETKEYLDFMGKVISRTKNHMLKANEAQVKAVQLVDEFKVKINDVKSLEELEELIEGINALSPMYKAQVNQVYERKFLDFWQPIFMNTEKLKTGEDFDALYALIKDLPDGVQLELRTPFKKLLDAAGLIYQKDKDPKKIGKYVLASNVKKEDPKTTAQSTPPTTAHKPPAPPPGPPAKVLHPEDWFIDRVGKKVLAKSDKFNGPMLIPDKATAGHLAHVSQKTGGYEFFEMPEEAPKEEPKAEEPPTAEEKKEENVTA